MAGKFTETEKDMKIGNKLNSNMVKVSSSKSILSYQNGSGLNIENCVYNPDEPVQNGFADDASTGDVNCCDDQNLKNDCLDILRKKLISDLSLNVFSTDLENKLTKMEPIEITKERHTVIQKLVVQISQLSDSEKLLLYLKLPSSTNSPFDPLRQPLNPLGNRQEIQQTIVWIKTHLEEDREISIPKQDVYDQYLKYCENVSMKPLSTADFGKVMKQVYPGVRPRRLGTRGNSRYCYSGMRNTCKLPTPVLPRLSLDSTSSNGNISDGSISTATETEKSNGKKSEKSKRKWKSSTSRSGKVCPAPNRTSNVPEKEGVNCQLKNAKRTKIENSGKGGKKMTFPDESDPSKPVGNAIKTEKSDLVEVKCEESSDNSFNAFDAMDYELGDDLGMYFENIEKVDEGSSGSGDEKANGLVNKENRDQVDFSRDNLTPKPDLVPEEIKKPFSTVNGDQSKSLVNQIVKNKQIVNGDCRKPKRANSFSKTQSKKSYVPIQPKPEALKLSVQFDFDRSIINNRKKNADLCEESDSQEPEEEIVRYFKHLDDNRIVGADVFVGQAVKNIDTVQINETANDISNNIDISNPESSSFNRSQSCFEVSSKSNYAPRSQSSVEFSKELRNNNDSSNKISHLRILLEKSMTCSSGDIPGNYIDNNQILSNQPGNNYSGVRDSVAKAQVPQSPNTRTKYFSFTPISPGPQSPMKTPSASPFVSPRNTPVPRSRQNSSQNDHFIPPSERNPSSAKRVDFSNEQIFNFSGVSNQDAQNYRPRSFSSTNFYRSKAKRNLTKGLSCSVAPNPLCITAPFQFPQTAQKFDLSNEVRKLLENNTKIEVQQQVQQQVSGFRSQSVPLNRMMSSESSWMSNNQISPVYGQIFNFSNPTPVPSEFSDFGADAAAAAKAEPQIPFFMPSEQIYQPETQTNENIMFQNNYASSAQNEPYDGSFDNAFTSEPDSVIADNIKSFLPSFETPEDKTAAVPDGNQPEDKLFKNTLYEGANDKDPVITSFKPVLMGEFSSSPNSPVLNFFGTKMNEDNQLIEFLDLDG